MEWRAESLDVPYMPCLSDQLFAIYRRWCERRREHVVSQTKFGGFLSAQDGLSRRRDVHYDQGQCSRKGTFLVPREPRQEFAQRPEESQAAWLGRCAAKFEFFVSTNQPGPS
jgi:putative DNA primase/helicase